MKKQIICFLWRFHGICFPFWCRHLRRLTIQRIIFFLKKKTRNVAEKFRNHPPKCHWTFRSCWYICIAHRHPFILIFNHSRRATANLKLAHFSCIRFIPITNADFIHIWCIRFLMMFYLIKKIPYRIHNKNLKTGIENQLEFNNIASIWIVFFSLEVFAVKWNCHEILKNGVIINIITTWMRAFFWNKFI